MAAAVGNLLDPADPSPADFASEEWFNFDLAVVGLGFHHFEDPTLAATRLAERLRPGGVLMIIDFMPHAHHGEIEIDGENGDGSSKRHRHGHEHGQGHFSHGYGGQGAESSLDPAQGSQENDNEKRFKEVMHTVAHAGFSKYDVYAAFEKAGVGKDLAFDVLKKDVVFRTNDRKITRQVFFARGTKA